jgi:hypothetical protein
MVIGWCALSSSCTRIGISRSPVSILARADVADGRYPDRVNRPSVETPRRASISARGPIPSSGPPRRRPAAGTIMRRNGRPPLSPFVPRPRHPVLGRTTRAANDHRDVTSLVGAVTPYPLNSSAMLAVMPFAATMSSLPPLRSPVRSLATPRPNSEDACRGLYRTADS